MLNKKGMTVLELMLAFSLSTIVIIYLFQIIALVQTLYIENEQKSNYLIKQNNLIDHIYRDLEKLQLTNVTACSGTSNCYNMRFADGTTKEISLYKNNGNTYVKYGQYVVNYSDVVKADTLTINKSAFVESDGIVPGNIYDSILRINIPMNMDSKQMDINIVYQYSSALNNVVIS